MTPDLLALTDAVAVSRMYRLALGAASLRHLDRDPEFAVLLRAAADEAGRLADTYAEIAVFVWSQRGSVPA
jgi:hypothetical protein